MIFLPVSTSSPNRSGDSSLISFSISRLRSGSVRLSFLRQARTSSAAPRRMSCGCAPRFPCIIVSRVSYAARVSFERGR